MLWSPVHWLSETEKKNCKWVYVSFWCGSRGYSSFLDYCSTFFVNQLPMQIQLSIITTYQYKLWWFDDVGLGNCYGYGIFISIIEKKPNKWVTSYKVISLLKYFINGFKSHLVMHILLFLCSCIDIINICFCLW